MNNTKRVALAVAGAGIMFSPLLWADTEAKAALPPLPYPDKLALMISAYRHGSEVIWEEDARLAAVIIAALPERTTS